jgi:hypothetical protein
VLFDGDDLADRHPDFLSISVVDERRGGRLRHDEDFCPGCKLAHFGLYLFGREDGVFHPKLPQALDMCLNSLVDQFGEELAIPLVRT